jgi:hypothetical protein
MLTSGIGACTPQALAKFEAPLAAPAAFWLMLCTHGTTYTALPEGQVSHQNTALATAAHHTKAAPTLGQGLRLCVKGRLRGMSRL